MSERVVVSNSPSLRSSTLLPYNEGNVSRSFLAANEIRFWVFVVVMLREPNV